MNKKKFYFTLILFSLLGQIAWVVENMNFNVFISKEFGANQFQVALMVSLSAIVATLRPIFYIPQPSGTIPQPPGTIPQQTESVRMFSVLSFTNHST